MKKKKQETLSKINLVFFLLYLVFLFLLKIKEETTKQSYRLRCRSLEINIILVDGAPKSELKQNSFYRYLVVIVVINLKQNEEKK